MPREVTTESTFPCNARLQAATCHIATQDSAMRPQSELETYAEEQERMAEYSRHLEMERQDRLGALRGALWDLVGPLGPHAVDLARFQAKIEALAHVDSVYLTASMLGTLAEAARAFADGASAAAVAACALIAESG
jgi:hypothetical protein